MNIVIKKNGLGPHPGEITLSNGSIVSILISDADLLKIHNDGITFRVTSVPNQQNNGVNITQYEHP